MHEADVQRIQDKEHLRILGILNYVVSGLFAFSVLAGIPFISMMMSDRFGTAFERARERAAERGLDEVQGPVSGAVVENMETFMWVFMGTWMAIVVVAAVLSFLNGRYLRSFRYSTFSTVVAALQCLMIPLGTVLGVFTLIVLGRPTVRDAYARARGEPVVPERG